MKFSPLIAKSITNTYLGHAHYEGSNVWGNYFYIQIVNELLDPTLLSNLRNHNQYETEIDDIDWVLFAFKFTPEQKTKIINPFLEGKYSKIDREYVRENFPMNSNGKVSMNWRILNKDTWQIPHGIMPLREYWHRRIGQAIPVEGEVWPKAKMEYEIYDYYYEYLQAEVADCQTASS